MLQPTLNRVLIQYLEPKEEKVGEIIVALNDQNQNGKPARAEVIAVGPGERLAQPYTMKALVPSGPGQNELVEVTNLHAAMPFVPGMKVLVARFKGHEVRYRGALYVLIDEKDILAILPDGSKFT